jgi:hypothetical protein
MTSQRMKSKRGLKFATNSGSVSIMVSGVPIDSNVYMSVPKSVRDYIRYSLHLSCTAHLNRVGVNDFVIRRSMFQDSMERDKYNCIIRWKVVCLIEGLIIGRRVLRKGLGKIEVVNCIRNKYEVTVDPDYVDSIILSREYDPRVDLKRSYELKIKAHKYNRSISRKIKNIKDAKRWALSLKKNDTIYISDGYTNLSVKCEKYTYVGKKTINRVTKLTLMIEGIEFDMCLSSIVNRVVTNKDPYDLRELFNDKT